MFSIRSIPFLIGAATVTIIVCASFLHVDRSVGELFQTFLSSMNKNNLEWKKSSDYASFDFTLQRKHYPVLSSFTPSRSEFLKYGILEGYNGIIEPYAHMLLNIADRSEETSRYHFKICPVIQDDKTTCYESEKDDTDGLAIPCSPHSDYEIEVREFDLTTSALTGRATGLLKCLYVRREISALTERDLNETLDALHTLWEYDESSGQELFGENFHSSTYFAEAHHFQSAWLDSDHIHEGLGFFTQHVKLTNRVEKAMQSVNPKVSMPYWEFTKEVAEGKSIFESYMFSEKTFGTLFQPADLKRGFQMASESPDDGAIQDGRWAKIKVDKLRFTGMSHAYGLLKAPWSLNPSPYVTRYASNTPSLPSCENYLNLATYLDNTLIEFLSFVQKEPHASLHLAIGNVYGCDSFLTLLKEGVLLDETSVVSMCKVWSYYVKDLYRNKFLVPEISKTVGGKAASECDDSLENRCAYICDSDREGEMKTFLSKLINQKFLPISLPSNTWDTYHEFVCGGGAKNTFIGTHSESSSASDPSFWPAHPTQERLVHAKIMSNLYTSWNWPTTLAEGYVCDVSACYSYKDGLSVKGTYEECCKGHFEGDALMDFINDDMDSPFGETNGEILRATNPISDEYSMPYIYDEFDWSHCGDEDIMPIFEKQYQLASDAAANGLTIEQPVYVKSSPGVPGGAKGAALTLTKFS